MTRERTQVESSTDSKYKTTVHTLTVSRTANEVGGGTVGAIERIDVEATRSEKRGAGTYHRIVSYAVEEGIARVDEVAPTHPDSRNTDSAFRPDHVAALLTETDSIVRESVPEVECVKALSSTLRNERAKRPAEHPHASVEEGEA